MTAKTSERIVTEHGHGAARSPVCAPSEFSGQSKAKAGQGSQARLNQCVQFPRALASTFHVSGAKVQVQSYKSRVSGL